jgi:hypothetical protein
MPSANTDSCSSAPPENRLNKPRNEPDCVVMILRMTLRSTPGVVMKIPTRYTANIPSVYRSRFRSSGILNMFKKAFMGPSVLGSLQVWSRGSLRSRKAD